VCKTVAARHGSTGARKTACARQNDKSPSVYKSSPPGRQTGLPVAGEVRPTAASARSEAQEVWQPRVCAGASAVGDFRHRDEKKLLRFQKQIASYELLIVDELGFVPLSKTGAELLFEMLSQRYERGPTLITSNLPFLLGRSNWTEWCCLNP
jgi:hypothetical protein